MQIASVILREIFGRSLYAFAGDVECGIKLCVFTVYAKQNTILDG